MGASTDKRSVVLTFFRMPFGTGTADADADTELGLFDDRAEVYEPRVLMGRSVVGGDTEADPSDG